MRKEMFYFGVKNKELMLILCGLYAIIIGVSIWKLCYSFRETPCGALTRQRIFYVLVFTIGCSRILWVLDPWINFGFASHLLMDSLCSTFQGILGLTFSILWFEMYVSSNISYTEKKQKQYLIKAIIAYIMLITISFACHIVFIYGNIQGNNAKWILTVSIDMIISTLCSISLFISGKLLNKNIKFAFTDNDSYRITSKIKFITLCTGIAYLLKTILLLTNSLFVEYLHSEYFALEYFPYSVVMFFLYYVGLEILPIFIVLFILKVSRVDTYEEHSLPSVLLPHNANDMSLSIKFSRDQIEKRLFNTLKDEKMREEFSLTYQKSYTCTA
ncbi:hypothetical protein SteCoe_6896 [Stentor coeruleus]|uniref:THH1/TOM1/TOM3 domain-containing protein n=1 Tax=Stentor coeruleus TaxID=5963 RepID=A0A1R2CP23_9CILI|nr:hypothetical protein SteCoe_6896 [Stentor coeruleus]